VLEAIEMCEELTGEKFNYEYTATNRTGDHIWWISDVSKFKSHYPGWQHKFGIKETIRQIYENEKGIKIFSY
jgi:CDP-paratose 2-epimerase